LLLSLVEGHPKKRAFEIGKRVGMCRETTQEQVLGKLQLSF
jgi:hypothetical protein